MRKIRSAKDFKKAMEDIAAETGEKAALINQKLALDGFNFVVFASPVQSGYLRNNWDIAVDVPAPAGSEKGIKGKVYPEPQIPTGEIKKIKWNSIATIYNNTAYARDIEEGTEKMPAQPMVKPAEQSLYRQAEMLCDQLSKEKSKI